MEYIVLDIGGYTVCKNIFVVHFTAITRASNNLKQHKRVIAASASTLVGRLYFVDVEPVVAYAAYGVRRGNKLA